ncbi:MAG: selenium-dependent molybdenum cofactor biosynthesis protein YqeB [Pseudomonadota bacterium]
MDYFGDLSIVIKGAGEMASGIAHRLYQANFTRICLTEIANPLAVRRTVAFCEAVHDGFAVVEGVGALLARNKREVSEIWADRNMAVLVDPDWKIYPELRPDVVIDAILAKKNLGTTKEEAPLVIGVGPGFTVPDEVHVAVESNRGHNLGRTIYAGTPEPHTGVPGLIGGFGRERLLRAPHAGTVHHVMAIGARVRKGDLVLHVDETPVLASIDGIIRGLIREMPVTAGRKLGDIDPRGEIVHCHTISEKARAIAGGVLEALIGWVSRGERAVRPAGPPLRRLKALSDLPKKHNRGKI